jgi:hypothetical protein
MSSSVGGVAFGFAPLFTQLAVQQNVVAAAAWTGFLVSGALVLGRRPDRARGLSLGAFVALSFLSGSPETLLWQALLMVALLIARRTPGRAVAAGGLSFGWGLMAVGVVLVPAVEFVLHSERAGGVEAPLQWSMPWVSLGSMAWLNLDLPRPQYAGSEQSFVPVLFQGTVVSALALWGATRRPRLRRPATAVLGVGVGLGLVALGRNFAPAEQLLSLWPFALFRYPVKYVVGAAFCLCVLAALGLDRLGASTRHLGPRRGLGLGVLALAVSVALVARPLSDGLGLRDGAGPGLAWGAVFLGVAGLAVSLRVHLAVALVALVELVTVQGLAGMEGWIPAGALTRGPAGLGDEIPRPQLGRLSVRLTNEAALKDGMAYVARSRASLVPLRFVEERLRAVEGYGAPEPRWLDSLLEEAPRETFELLGVTDYVREGEQPPFPGLRRVPSAPGLPFLWRSDTAQPRAFVVHEAQLVTDEAARLALLDASGPGRTRAGLASGAPLTGHACPSTASIVEERLQRLVVVVDACAEGYLVLSERSFPGWEAEVDGVESPLLRADLLLRAVRVPPGQHRVTFTYRPGSVRVGLGLSVLALVGALLTVLRRRRGHEPLLPGC